MRSRRSGLRRCCSWCCLQAMRTEWLPNSCAMNMTIAKTLYRYCSVRERDCVLYVHHKLHSGHAKCRMKYVRTESMMAEIHAISPDLHVTWTTSYSTIFSRAAVLQSPTSPSFAKTVSPLITRAGLPDVHAAFALPFTREFQAYVFFFALHRIYYRAHVRLSVMLLLDSHFSARRHHFLIIIPSVPLEDIKVARTVRYPLPEVHTKKR